VMCYPSRKHGDQLMHDRLARKHGQQDPKPDSRGLIVEGSEGGVKQTCKPKWFEGGLATPDPFSMASEVSTFLP
jgi:hypothetical protein